MDDVMPFLENVTRGRNVPRERLEEVAHHYERFGGVSPINAQNRELIAALERELRAARHRPADLLRQPQLAPVPRPTRCAQMTRRTASPRARRSSPRRSARLLGLPPVPREHLRRAGGGRAGRARGAAAARCSTTTRASSRRTPTACATALGAEPARARTVVFTAHSIPAAMAERCRYEASSPRRARLVAEAAGADDYAVVYQSRSGPPHVPVARAGRPRPPARARTGAASPTSSSRRVGFVSDHLEVLYDLDVEAAELGRRARRCDVVRAGTPGTHPAFVAMIRELIQERLEAARDAPALGRFGPNPDTCAPNCCLPGTGRPSPWEAVARRMNVLFVCIGNQGRSVMAERLFRRAAAGRHEARSAGSWTRARRSTRAGGRRARLQPLRAAARRRRALSAGRPRARPARHPLLPAGGAAAARCCSRTASTSSPRRGAILAVGDGMATLVGTRDRRPRDPVEPRQERRRHARVRRVRRRRRRRCSPGGAGRRSTPPPSLWFSLARAVVAAVARGAASRRCRSGSTTTSRCRPPPAAVLWVASLMTRRIASARVASPALPRCRSALARERRWSRALGYRARTRLDVRARSAARSSASIDLRRRRLAAAGCCCSSTFVAASVTSRLGLRRKIAARHRGGARRTPRRGQRDRQHRRRRDRRGRSR